MLKNNRLIAALVFTCLVISTIITVSYSATTFDNSDFVSEISSEEKARIKQQAIEDDYDAYQQKLETGVQYSNFSSFSYINNDDDFKGALKQAYDEMAANPEYDEQQKDDYYNAYIGTEEVPGLMRNMYEFSKIIDSYKAQTDVVVDSTRALEIIDSYGSPKLNINNIEYMNSLSLMLNEIAQSFEPKAVSSLTDEELQQARLSNVIFSQEMTAIFGQVQYFSMPNTPLLKRLTHNEVLFNIGLLIAMIVLFVTRFPTIKKQQEYAWNGFRPLTLLVIPAVAVVFFGYFTWFFSVPYTIEAPIYTMYLDGVPASTSTRIYQDQESSHTVTLVASGSEFTVSTASFEIIVSGDPALSASGGDLSTTGFGDLGLMKFTATSGKNQVVLPLSENQYSYANLGQVIQKIGIEATDNYEPDELGLSHYIDHNRNEFILPMSLRLVIPSLMFGVLYFMYILMPGPMVKMYLNELYTINKFCGFLSYNMAYRSNARVLIEETLQSLEACKFAEDFAIIFFEKERDMTDKIQDISQIYSYKFFEMYLGIVNIIFDEGVSDSTLKSLSIIQQFGDEYYNQADMFFKSKKGAMSALMMIIAICVALPAIVKNSVGEYFSLYMTVPNGYTMTIGSYLIWFGLICVINNMYKDNKIVRAEGRYV